MKKLTRLDIRRKIEKRNKSLQEGSRDDTIGNAMAPIEKQFGGGAINNPSFDELMMKQMQRAKSPDVVQDIGLAYDLMLKLAPGIDATPPIHRGATIQSGIRQAAGKIAVKTNLGKRFILFHLKKAIAHEKKGKLLGLPTGNELVMKAMEHRGSSSQRHHSDIVTPG